MCVYIYIYIGIKQRKSELPPRVKWMGETVCDSFLKPSSRTRCPPVRLPTYFF